MGLLAQRIGQITTSENYFTTSLKVASAVFDLCCHLETRHIKSADPVNVFLGVSYKGNKVEEQNEVLTRIEGRRNTHSPAGNPSPTLGHSSTQQRWVPPSFRLQDLSIDPNESIFRKTRSILNKLTPEKFDKLCQEILNIGIDNKAILKGIVILIYEKAIDELRYSSLYANLCRRLYHEAPNFDTQTPVVQGRPAPKPNTFRRILIAKLQDEFENRNKNLESFDSKEGELTSDEEEQQSKAKQHMLGNIKFIGELYRLGLLHESIVHKCVKQLINKKKKGTVDDLAEDLECLCQIMTTCGRRLDHEKAKSLMDQYFDRLEKLQKRRTELPSRIRFMLQDVIELRSAGWVPRSVHIPQGPKTLGEIRVEVGEDYPSLMFDQQVHRQSTQPRPRPNAYFEDHKTAAGLGFFPMSKKQQYDGFGMPSSPPLNTAMNGEPTSPGPDFDFFSSPPSTKSNAGRQPGKPTGAHGQFTPAYMNQMNLHNGNHMQPYMSPAPYHQPQQQMMFNGYGMPYAAPGYGPGPGNMQPLNRPAAANPPPSNGMNESSKNQKSRQARVLPPRMMKHRHGNNLDSPTDTDTAFSQNKAFAKNARTPDQPPTKPTFSSVPSSNPQSYSPKNSFRGSPTNAKPNPITPATADTFQPPYQHVLDRAQSKPVRKSNSNPNFEKNKTKKNAMSEKEAGEVVDNFLADENLERLESKLKEAKISKRHMTVVCGKLYLHALSGSDSDREKMCKVLKGLLEGGVLTDDHLLEGINNLSEKLKTLESEMPRIKSLMASLLSHAVSHELITLSQVAEGLEGGYNFPLFLLMLQHLSKTEGRDWLSRVMEDSKVEMMKMMPEVSQNKASMLEILEMKNLSFLFPLLHMEARLAAQLSTNAAPQVVYRWIKDNVSLELHTDPGFISVLMTSCLHYITKQASLAPGVDHTQAAPKEVQERERTLLSGIKVVLQKFIHDKPELQLRALYAVQVFCHAAKFPKGLMLRLFDLLYHEDVIDEEIFLKWKEDVNDEFPGKGKSLFQVNSWLTWLEEADTEDEDDED